MIRLYGRNSKRVPSGERSFWTDIEAWVAKRRRRTGREPLMVNVTSHSKVPEFRNLSPMLMGPVNCYREKGRRVTAASVEVAWQYSKVFSHVRQGDKLVDVTERFITRDAKGRMFPSREWFLWRDAAFKNSCFVHTHPDFKAHRNAVRYPFPKGPKGLGSKVAFWYWNAETLDALQARQIIYARLYRQFVLKTRGFQQLRKMASRGVDLKMFDRDGYDWVELGMTPADCVRHPHSFGHGMVISFLLQGINPTKLVTN